MARPVLDLAGPVIDLALSPTDLSSPPEDLGARALALRFEAPPSMIGSGIPFSIRVDVIDPSSGAIVTGVYPVISVKRGAATNSAGALTGSVPRLPTSGVAQFDGLTIDRWGQYTLIATAPGLGSSESMSFRVQGVNPAFVVQPTNAFAGQPMMPPAQVAFEDATGDIDLLANGITYASVLFPPSGCNNYVSSTSGPLVNGVATFSNLLIDRACTGYRLEVGTLGWSVPGAVSASFDVEVGAAVGLTLGSTTTSLVRGTPFDLSVKLIDAGGNLVTAAAPVVATLSLPSTVSWTGPSTTTISNGVGVFSGVTVDTVGDFTATASAPGLKPALLSLQMTAWELRSTTSYDSGSRIFVSPNAPDVVYLTGHGLSKSTDGGRSFTQVSTVTANDLAFDPMTPTTIYVATLNGVLRSVDGTSFATLGLRSDNYNAIAVDPHLPATVWAAASKDLWRSTDGGATWTNLTPATASSVSGLAIDPSGTVFVGGDTVRKSIDGGATWTSGVGLPAYVFTSISVDPITPTRVYACEGYFCYASSDAGANWLALAATGSRVTIDPVVHTTIYLPGGSGLLKSRDSGASWVTIPFPNRMSVSNVAIVPSNSDELYARTDNDIYRSLTGGE